MSLCLSVLMFERSWWLGETPEDWKKANISFVFTKDETWSGKLQDSQFHIDPQEGYEANKLGKHLQIHEN